ncbi:PTS sugar transporter subunit IIB [Polycladomyces subterraneus]|uniref:PTS sugar transporter subunit IIB n=1 Tax=Polycladomyces subterraneus TaxID=1016997 RepID=A0ABT8IHR0_9BACL|nr:PTS sugar transporter subunit IIB [Polycladomyces subterraneus]MDN4592329.1 PTS sugar transporter subunit IIB [Polycladomyces subterraneus]
MRILLCCSGGMSTSLLAERMKQAARDRGMTVDIQSIGIHEFASVVRKFDVVLLGPQIRHKWNHLKSIADANGIPIAVIDPVAYGMIDGQRALKQALACLPTP